MGRGPGLSVEAKAQIWERWKDTATPSLRELIERFLKEKNAQLWIGHSTAFFKNAIKSPGWYD